MKILIGVMLAVVLLFAFTAPALADQPNVPGCFGELVSDAAQNDDGPGASSEVHQGQLEAEEDWDTNLGQFFQVIHTDFCGIPPKHLP